MDIWYKVDLVQKMQDYIAEHANESSFNFDDLYSSVGYSKRHADRCFKDLLGKTPREYLRLIKMSDSAIQLAKGNQTVLEIALNTDFLTHDGYTKAFREAFGKLPSEYKKGKSFIPLFIPYPIKDYYSHILNKEKNKMEKRCLCMITPVKRPERKLIFLRSLNANDYWTFCQEKCCDWEGLLNSNPAKFDTAAILTLPKALVKEGYSNIASGIEVPADYDGEIPKDYEQAKLEPCEMLYFQSQPYENEEDFSIYIEEVFKAADTFNYAAYGYKIADNIAPRFNFGAECKTGAKIAIPIERI